MSKKPSQHRGLKFAMLSLVASSWALADITGTVYKDFDLNGQKDGGDTFVSGVSIKAVCEDGKTYTATTDTNGAYTLTGFPAGNKCRVEVDPANAGVGSGPNANGSAPLVDMVIDGSVHHVSVGSPATYCQASPDVVMAAMPGYYLHEGEQKSPINSGTLFKVPTPNIGTFNNNGTIAEKRTTLAKIEDTGAIWGTAWKKGSKDIFLASNIKRYVALKGDAGAIYKVDNANNVTLFTTVPNATTAAANTVISSRTYAFNEDKEVLPYVGRQGLGDIDINEAETELYVVNMNTKELVVLDATNGAILKSVAIPNPYGASCPAEDVRPWALKARGTDVFIGSVCESKITDNVGATIQKYNGAIVQTMTQTNSLRYLRPRGYDPANKAQDDGYRYSNWSDLSYINGPMLTDIEFTNSGDLVLGYISRIAYNRIAGLRGDIRKMCLNADGTYTDESSDVAQTNCGTHTVNYTGNPTNYFEFYTGDYFGANLGETGHPETASGALAQAPGAPNIIVGMIDGTDWYQPGAIGLYSNTTGDKIGAQAVIDNTVEGERDPYGGKAGGVGDVELLCDAAPIEIGNYVWMDINQDGIQDPNEPAMAEVPVKLTCEGSLIGTAITDSNGHYYFGGLNNANLTAGKSISAGKNCELIVAHADVNGKPATVANPANVDDGIDNDAVSNGTDNVIAFTTTVSNDHSLDFGIAPALGCVSGILFNDVDGSGTQGDLDASAPAGIKLIITDAFGNRYETNTAEDGTFTLANIPAGKVSVKVDSTDTDIPEGAVWTSLVASNVSVSEGVTPNCAKTNFPFALPAPTAQDPKDVAVCANPTSITWEGATVSSASTWKKPVIDTPANFTTSGGATVDVTMKITNDVNGEYFADESGTSGAFNTPYLTLYLGNQDTAGNGTWNDAGNCAANGYDLEAGESYQLEVTFSEPVILDNWRIRDVDSGDDRSGAPNWNWQDGIKVEGFDADNANINVEAKIGSAGAGLMVDSDGIVHTDPSTYNAGNIATGTGSTPNATNGHIVLSSNMVPVSKIIITHIAGPDVPCQTRSALAMAGLSVCKPLHISGHVYNDEDGVVPANTCDTSDNKVDGSPINDIDGTALNVCLVDATGKVLDTQVLNNGAYNFDKYILPNANYKVVVTTATCTKGTKAPKAVLSESWYYEGEQIDPANNVGNAGIVDGMINVSITTEDIPNIDFALNKAPTALGYTRASELNPGGTTQVTFDTDGADTSTFIGDAEETTPARIKIIQVPSAASVYYSNAVITAGQIIDTPVMSDFKIDPADGDSSAGFTYVSMDKSCRVSKEAVFTATFGVPKISGFLYLDKNNNDQVDDKATDKSCDATTPVYVNLINKNNNTVISAIPLEEDGSYVFYNPDVNPNTSYDLILSTTQGKKGEERPSADLPKGCMHTSENKGKNATNREAESGDGIITVDVVGTDIPELNFGISPSVKIGDLVWIEDDNDGDATTGSITPVSGATVTALCNNVNYTAETDSNGKYLIDVPQNAVCIVSTPTPQGSLPALGSASNNSITDSTSGNNKSHNNSGTNMKLGTVDNLTADFGFSSKVTDGTYKIGTHFWIDENANGVFDTTEKPISGALIELFDANGSKIRETTTSNSGEYGFDVPEGSYKVRFNIPNKPEYEGFVFSQAKVNTDDTRNVNSANTSGFTQSVTVGPNEKAQILTMDAGINCGCANVSSDSSDAQSKFSMLSMMFFTLMIALYFVRKEDEKQNV